MMVKLSDLRSDPELEVAGVWYDYPLGGRFRVARAWNVAYSALIERKLREWDGVLDARGNPPADVHRQWAREAFAETILRDWADVEPGDDGPQPYDVRYGLTIATDPAHHDLYQWIWSRAADAAAYRERRDKAALGNS